MPDPAPLPAEEMPVTINAAAKAIGMNRDELRRRCKAAGVLIRWGGGEKREFVKVLLSEARRVVLSDRVPPPGVSAEKWKRLRGVPPPAGRPLNPLVKC